MKRAKRRISIIVALVMLFTLLMPTSVMAATAKANNSYHPSGTATYYKVSVSGEGILTLKENYYCSASLYDANKEALSAQYYVTSTTSIMGSRKYAVSKGTYYIKAYSWSSYHTGTFSYSISSVKQPTNYCKAKAVSLSKGTSKTVVQTENYHFGRWFKITLTSAQYITVYNTKSSAYGTFYIYSAKGKRVSTTYPSNSSYYVTKTSAKVAKGTYYIYIPASIGYSEIIQFKWS